MCTAISFIAKDHYFGRNLDLEYSYLESVTVTPRNYPFTFQSGTTLSSHLAMIGIATVAEDYPLYYDATNEAGLSMAGLNFPGNARYHHPVADKLSIAPFELIAWVLSQCHTTAEAIDLLQKTNVINHSFSPEYPVTDQHWIISDGKESITVESRKSELTLADNPVGVLTNNPPFEYHLQNLCNYMHLSNLEPKNRLSQEIVLQPYSRGMGALGLPGDLSSASRFIRACFTKLNSVKPSTEAGAVNQFFHILGSVEQQEGCVRIGDGFEKTVYSSCCNTTKGIYYYTTYENSQITGVNLYHENINSNQLVSYPLIRSTQIVMEN